MEKKLRPIHGFIAFAIFVAFMLTGGVLLQYSFGLLGIAVTEMGLLVLALFFPRIVGADLQSVYDFSPPPVSSFFSSLIFGAGAYFGVVSVEMLTAYFFEGARASAQSLNALITSQPAAVAIIVAAILPAICENFLFFGCIRSSFNSWKRPVLIALTVGLMFGIGHFDIYRLLPMTILGAALVYIGIRTKSILLGALLHFIFNVLSVISAFSSVGDQASNISDYSPFTVIGSAVAYASFAVILLVLGSSLLKKKRLSFKTYLISGIITIVGFLTGIGLVAFGDEMSSAAIAGAIFYDGAIALIIFGVGLAIVTRKKPTKKQVVSFFVAAALCFGIGAVLGLVGAPPPTFLHQLSVTAKEPTALQTFTVTEEGDYVFTVRVSNRFSSLRVSLLQELPEEESKETSSPETETDPEQEAAPDAFPNATYYATFEGTSIGMKSRTVHLLPGTYTVFVSLSPIENAPERGIYGSVIAMLNAIDEN